MSRRGTCQLISAQDAAPVAHNAAPVSHNVAPVVHNVAPVTHNAAPVAHNAASLPIFTWGAGGPMSPPLECAKNHGSVVLGVCYNQAVILGFFS
jgi:hypothetical protein